jgi:ABC-type transporter Mla subunit MlaD
MARKRTSRSSDAERHGSPDTGTEPGVEAEAVLAAARAEVGGLGKRARRRLERLERKLGTALRVEAKRRRKLGEALGEVAGLVARVRDVVRPSEPGGDAAAASDTEPTPNPAAPKPAAPKSAEPKAATPRATAPKPATTKPATRRRTARPAGGADRGSGS